MPDVEFVIGILKNEDTTIVSHHSVGPGPKFRRVRMPEVKAKYVEEEGLTR